MARALRIDIRDGWYHITNRGLDRQRIFDVTFNQIVSVVEKEIGEKWNRFFNRHGDKGRDMVLYLARKRSGLTLREIGECAGGLEYKTVGKAIERFGRWIKTDSNLTKSLVKCLRQLSNVET